VVNDKGAVPVLAWDMPDSENSKRRTGAACNERQNEMEAVRIAKVFFMICFEEEFGFRRVMN